MSISISISITVMRSRPMTPTVDQVHTGRQNRYNLCFAQRRLEIATIFHFARTALIPRLHVKTGCQTG